jgi:hypothetical protein
MIKPTVSTRLRIKYTTRIASIRLKILIDAAMLILLIRIAKYNSLTLIYLDRDLEDLEINADLSGPGLVDLMINLI